MKKWEVILTVTTDDERTAGDLAQEVLQKLTDWVGVVVDDDAAVFEETPPYCCKKVPNPDGYPGTACCRLKFGHEGACQWPWK